MKTIQIETINLLKLYVITISSAVISIIVSILIASIFIQNFIFTLILVFIIGFVLIYLTESYSKKTIKIIINKEGLIIENKSIQFKNIKIIRYKYFFRNYPFLKIETANNRSFKIRSSKKVNQNLEKLVSIIQNKIKA